MKMIHALVRSCGDCPFLEFIEDPVETSQGTFEKGWFCLHKSRRQYVLMERDTDVGLRRWLQDAYGQPFPPDCPLPDTGTGHRTSGVRDLDLQSGVRVDK